MSSRKLDNIDNGVKRIKYTLFQHLLKERL